MSKPSSRKGLSLRWLELFQACARSGSLSQTAKETGLSTSTISHHLRSLEDHLGVALFDHARRPMVLTPRGKAFLRDIETALQSIRAATAGAATGDLGEPRYLRLGTIEDLDSDVTPALAVHLSRHMPECDFLYHISTSHEILQMLHDRELDLGVTTTPPERLRDLQAHPLLRDPFVVVLPVDSEPPLADIVAGKTPLPFIRFSNDLIIANQIEAQLRRLGVSLPHKVECGSNQTLMAMVAAGAGWTITTPLLFSRAKRFQDRLKVHPFPGKRFSRTLSLVTGPDCAPQVLDLVDGQIRAALSDQVIAPLIASTPWLEGDFALIEAPTE